MNNIFFICALIAGAFFLLAKYSNVDVESVLRPNVARMVVMIMSFLMKVIGAILVIGSYWYLFIVDNQ